MAEKPCFQSHFEALLFFLKTLLRPMRHGAMSVASQRLMCSLRWNEQGVLFSSGVAHPPANLTSSAATKQRFMEISGRHVLPGSEDRSHQHRAASRSFFGK